MAACRPSRGQWLHRSTQPLFGLLDDACGPAELLRLIGPSSSVAPLVDTSRADAPRAASLDAVSPGHVASAHVGAGGDSEHDVHHRNHSTKRQTVQYKTLDDIIAALPPTSVVAPEQSGFDQRSQQYDVDAATETTTRSTHASADSHGAAEQLSSRAERVRTELMRRHVHQQSLNKLIETLVPSTGDARVASIVDLSAEARRNQMHPYAQYQYDDGSTHPSDSHGATRAAAHGAHDSWLFVRQQGGASGPSEQSYADASAREEHYRRELLSFYEALYDVTLDDTTLPSGASKPPSTHFSPAEYRVRHEALQRHWRNVPLLLSKFHGYEEDLFKMLKAKYDAPAYRFVHHQA